MKVIKLFFINLKRLFLYLFLASLLILGFVWFVVFSVNSTTKDKIYSDINQVPQAQTILVLGALVHSNGSLSGMLLDRVTTTYELYDAGKAPKILVSGDHGRVDYDEVNTIKDYLLSKGVKPEDIFLDHAGFDTYDSIYRARDIFEVKSMIIVTQKFHLPRAVYIADKLGVEAVGFTADKQEYAHIWRFTYREYFADIKAWFNILLKSKPKYLGPVISITGDSKESWDQ